MTYKNPTLVSDLIFTLLQFIILKNYVTGFLALYFVLKANDFFREFNYSKYEEYTKYGRIIRIIGWALSICFIIFLFLVRIWELFDFNLGRYGINAVYT